MSCPDIIDLERYVEQDLSGVALRAMDEHLRDCSECARQMQELRENLRLAPALRRDPRAASAPQIDPKQIGPYRILRRLGEGGMGTVFEAEQENPRRVVALKVVRPGLVSTGLLARFRREAQALGRLQHPGIAQIYEAGTHPTDHGPQPYLVMERVHGPMLLDYAEAQRLDLRQRLELMARICDAVQHAHQNGIIHRDLKPENILVDDSTGAPQPKILDFGVARVVDPAGQNTTMFTSAGQIVGTVAYMSPEQAGADPEQLDMRSDVYALGVICYQLLSGRLPYRLNMASIAESVRVIVQDEPTPLASIDRSLRGDVTTIVGKALEKEKSRRYPSAAEMGADIRRFLRDEPITARQPSTIYQLRKFARRNKGLVSGVAAAFLLLILGVVGTSIGMVRAQHSAEEARREAAKQAAVNDFLQEMLSAANPRNLSAADRAKGREVTVLEVLHEAARRIDEGSLRNQPEVEAAARSSVGVAYQELGDYERASHHLDQALALYRRIYGQSHRSVAKTLNSLSVLRRLEGRFDDAEQLAREALELCRRLMGDDHEDVLTCMNTLSLLLSERGDLAGAEALLRQVLAGRRKLFGSEHRAIATILNNLAMLMEQSGRLSEAEATYRQALEMRRRLLGPEHPEVAITLNNLGFALRAQGRLEEAESAFRDALEMRRKLLGEEHPDVALALNNLASLLQARQKFDEAEPLYREALAMQQRLHGEEHPSIAASLNNLATLERDRGRREQAAELFRQSLEMRRRLYGEDHPAVALALNNLAGAIRDLGKLEEAEALARKAVAMTVARLGLDHIDTANFRTQLGACLLALSRDEEAEQELLEARRVLRSSQLPADDRRNVAVEKHLATLYERANRPEQPHLVGSTPATQAHAQP